MKNISTILIVDDQQAMRDTFDLVLSGEENNLVFAASGERALEKANKIVPDLILLDVMMPDMDGFEVCQRLRANSRLSEVPIIMITALNDTRSRLRGLESGADEFISKPFDVTELRARVKTITRLNRYRRLVAERTKFEWVVANANDGYVVLNNDQQLVYANDQARRYLNLNLTNNLTGDVDFIKLICKFYQQEPDEAWSKWPEAGEDPLYLIKHAEKEAEFWLQVDTLPLTNSKQGRWMIRLQDVTEQMVMRRDMWRFHLAVTHKFRTPLVGMLSGLELLYRHAEQLSRDDIVKLSQTAYESAKRLHDEVNDVIRYLKSPRTMESNDGILIGELPRLIARIGKEMELKKEDFNLRGVKALKDIHLQISTEALEIIFWELIENSIKFHPEKKPIISIFLAADSTDSVTITFQDNGLHLTPEQLNKIWTPYYQSEPTFTGEVKGMGLGLPMVSSILWSVRGHARVYNREDHAGVAVELKIPLFKNTPPASES